MCKPILVVALALLVAPAAAETPQAFVGVWKVIWDGATRPQEAKLVIKPSGGTWQTFARTKSDPCVGREVPIAVFEVSPKEVVIDLKFSEVITGCPDAKVELKLGDDGKLTGKRGKYDLSAQRN